MHVSCFLKCFDWNCLSFTYEIDYVLFFSAANQTLFLILGLKFTFCVELKGSIIQHVYHNNYCLKKIQNAPRPSEHPPVRVKKYRNV